jgi:hypothetical protein
MLRARCFIADRKRFFGFNHLRLDLSAHFRNQSLSKGSSCVMFRLWLARGDADYL